MSTATKVTPFEDIATKVATAAAPAKSQGKFDVSRFRASSSGANWTSSEPSMSQSQFPVRKPGKAFFQAHPDEGYYLFSLRALEDSERNVHLLDPDFNPPEEISRFVFSINLGTCITHKGRVFLWPFRESTNDWSKSAKTVLRTARSEWVRIRPDMGLNCYMIERAPEELAAIQPKWPDVSFDQIFNSAFDGRMVQDANNPVVRELQGKP